MGSVFGISQQEVQKPVESPRKPITTLPTITSICSIQQNQIENNQIFVPVKCCRCNKYLQDNDFFLLNCGQQTCLFKFHKFCFYKELNDQNKKANLLYYKCKCGTKIPSKFLRICGAPNKMQLLSSIHQKQLDAILKFSILRKQKEILEYCNQNKAKEHELDFFLEKQDFLMYEETPQ
ncbi:unnamed protein product [Paramecium sonneborni]|uniref:Uncharacterized protein n=1 Tax=Paramecium sonneborni TaxID=65129 RepID=A0A8S1MXY2_9CILI|nr:unnamed protein product [Paramecium sonneborni]